MAAHATCAVSMPKKDGNATTAVLSKRISLYANTSARAKSITQLWRALPSTSPVWEVRLTHTNAMAAMSGQMLPVTPSTTPVLTGTSHQAQYHESGESGWRHERRHC